MGPGPHLIKFVLSASVNWVRTPDLLQLFGYVNHAKCPLCAEPLCSLHHILANCKTALHGKRYTWRHDSVLGCLENHLRPHVESFNENLKHTKLALHISKSFHRKGEGKARRATRPPTSMLTGATDWRIQVEYDDALTPFPAEIYSTSQRPDIVIWSVALKRVLIIELTCPAEEGIEAAQIRKEGRYAGLVVDCRDSSWSPSLFTIEIGARGFVCRSLHRCLSALGVTSKTKKALCKTVSLIAAKCSLTIFQSHTSHVWDKNRVRLSADLWQPRPPLHSIRLITNAPTPDGETHGVDLANAGRISEDEEDVQEESEDEKSERGH